MGDFLMVTKPPADSNKGLAGMVPCAGILKSVTGLHS